MNKTQIEWVKNPDGTQGYTWNPITGCLNGCEYCYAYKLANTRLKERYLANKDIAPASIITEFDDIGADPFYPRFWEERLRELDPTWKGKHFTVGGASKVQPKGIFVCDMSDLFGIGIPDEWTRRVLDVIRMNHNHRFYLLTKQPQNLPAWSPFPGNAWVGVSATDYKMFSFALEYLKDIQAAVRFISIEPMLDRLNVPLLNEVLGNCGIDWVIIGAVTGTKQELLSLKTSADLTLMPYGKKWTLQPKIEWVEEIVSACDKAGAKVFLKDNLRPLLPEESPFYDVIDEDPMMTLRLRQEMPDG